MKKVKPNKPYWEMTTAELREATKEYDRENLNPVSVPWDPEEKKRHDKFIRRARAEVQEKLRSRGRPKVGEGARRVMVTVERGLLSEADALGKRRQVSRSQLMAEGLRLVLRKHGVKPALRRAS